MPDPLQSSYSVLSEKAKPFLFGVHHCNLRRVFCQEKLSLFCSEYTISLEKAYLLSFIFSWKLLYVIHISWKTVGFLCLCQINYSFLRINFVNVDYNHPCCQQSLLTRSLIHVQTWKHDEQFTSHVYMLCTSFL